MAGVGIMPSFDIVNEVDWQEMDNAVNQAVKEMQNRFDFRGSKSSLEFDRKNQLIKIEADDDMKLRAIHQMLEQKMAKRSLDLRALDYGDEQAAGGQMVRQRVTIKSGIDKDDAKRLVKMIKDTKLKVQAQIQDEQVRVTGKKIDDLQEVIQFLKSKEVGLPLQFTNMRS